MWRTLLVENQAIVRQGIKVILEHDEKMKVTRETENGRQAIEVLKKHLINFIMMDVRMPLTSFASTRSISLS